MRKDFLKTAILGLAAILSIGLVIPAHLLAQAEAGASAASPQNPPKPDQKNGTGIVPPGVTLVPQMPAAGAATSFHFPRSATKTLPNGLRVFVVSDHREPAIAARLVILSAGSLNDPANTPGVAAMTANLLTQGTEKRSEQDIAQAIDFVGGALSASADKDDTTVSVNVVKKDVELGMDLMSDVVLHPAFKQEELDRQVQQLLSNLQLQYSDPNYLASAVFNRVVFKGSKYGLPSEGTPESAKKFSRDLITKFHDDTFVPNQSLLAFAGDISPDEAFTLAEKYFGGWAQKQVGAVTAAAPEKPSGIHIWLVDKADAVQTQIRVGRPGIRRDDPDYIPLVVTNRIFGGGYDSRLNTEVRVNRGLTYGASSAFSSMKYAGAFRANTFTRTEATVEATKLVVDLIGKMSTGEVTPEELNFAKDYLAGVYPIQSETAGEVVNRVLTVAEYGLPEDYNDTYPDRIRAVDTAAVKQMSSRYMNAKDLDIVLAGNVGQFRDELKKDFPDATIDEIAFNDLDLLAPDLRTAKAAAVPAATPESLSRGNEILKAAADAAGGPALSSVDSLEITSTGKGFSPRGDVAIELKMLIAFPDKSRSEVKMPFGTIVQAFDGKAGWVQAPQGIMDLPPEYVSQFRRANALSGGWGLYRDFLNGQVKAQYLGEEDSGGKKLVAVQWNSSDGPIKLYFDPSSHLLVGAHFESITTQGPVETDQQWSDFRTIEGRQFPYESVVYRNGAKFSETTIQSVTVNPHPDPSVFSKPQ